MIPISLRLKNFIGIRDGLGRDEVFIDFTKFENGVIGIVGPTGSGKTVLAENMTHYLKMITRDGSLQSHCYGKSALKEFVSEMNGERYKSRIVISPESNSLKPYLYKWVDNDWLVLTDKKKEYDTAVASIFGDFDSFKRSVFTPQGDIPIITLKDTELKKMAIKLFGLERYSDYYIPAIKEELATIDTDIRDANVFIRAFEAKIDDLEMKKKEKVIIKKELDDVRLNFQTTKDNQDIAEALTKAKEAEIAKMYKDRESLRSLELELSEIQSKIKTVYNDNISDIKDIETSIVSNDKDLKNHQAKLLSDSKTIERWKKIVDNRGRIEDKYNEYITIKNKVDSYDEELKNRADLINTERLQKNKLSSVEREINTLSTTINDHNNRANLLDKVPCVSVSELNTTCPLLGDANTSKSKSIELSATVESLKKSYTEIVNNLKEIESKIRESASIQEERDRLVGEAQAIVDTQWVKLYGEIDEAVSMTKSYESDKEFLDQQIKICENVATELKERLDKEQGKLEKLLLPLKKRLDAVKNEIEIRGSMLNPITLEAELKELRYKESQARATCLTEGQEITELVTKLEMYDKEITELETEISKIESKKTVIDILLRDYEEWKILERAFKEIPVLELESASVVLTDFTNSLLSDVFSYDISIKVVTLMPKSTGGGEKDVFKIMVYKDGVEVLPKMLSGGEKQVIDSAFRMGIELTLKQASNYEYKTSIFDEADSAIDTERSLDFFKMVNKVHEINKKRFTFLITHRTEVKNQISQSIDMNKLRKF